MSEEFEIFAEEETTSVKKEKSYSGYPALKIVSMIFGIIAGALFIYYAYVMYEPTFKSIAERKSMGIQIGKTDLMLFYVEACLIFLCGICPIVGALLPNKAAKVSAVLTAAPIFWSFTTFLTFIRILLEYRISLSAINDSGMTWMLYIFFGGFFALLSAILIIVTPSYRKPAPADDSFIDEVEIDGLDEMSADTEDDEDGIFDQGAATEVFENIAEETVEEVNDTADTAEEIKDKVEEAADKEE